MNKYCLAILTLLELIFESQAYACNSCFGTGSENSTEALNWSMMTLFICIASVLVGFAFFFNYLKKREKRMNSNIKGSLLE